jgi:hypothetical protein
MTCAVAKSKGSTFCPAISDGQVRLLHNSEELQPTRKGNGAHQLACHAHDSGARPCRDRGAVSMSGDREWRQSGGAPATVKAMIRPIAASAVFFMAVSSPLFC